MAEKDMSSRCRPGRTELLRRGLQAVQTQGFEVLDQAIEPMRSIQRAHTTPQTASTPMTLGGYSGRLVPMSGSHPAGGASRVRMAKLVGLAALFAAGLLLSGSLVAVGVADVTTTETVPTTTTTTVSETATVPATTVVTTVEQTTTKKVIVPPSGKTTSSGSASTTPTWVWVVLAVLASAVVALFVALLTRRSGGIPAEERQQRLDATVASWAAQGWALENQTAGSAILRHGSELMVVSIDDKGQISTRPLPSS